VHVKRFIPFDPDQPLLLPPDLRSALPEGHAALLIADLADQLDLREITNGMPDGSLGGQPGFHPRVMVRIWLYAYTQGIRSSREVQRALVENIAFRVVAQNQTPGFWALNRFRTLHREALGNLLEQTVKLAAGMDLVNLGNVAIDGTKVKAYASKHKAMSYGRMDREEARLKEEIDAYVKEQVDAYLEACDVQDAKVDEMFGPDHDGFSLPEELRDTQARRNAIASARRELEARAVEKKEKEQEAKREAAAEEGRTYTPRKKAEDAKPKDRDQINFTDPESRIMVSDGSFVQAFNAQIAVDTESHIVLAAQVGNDSPDVNYLPGILDEVTANTGEAPKVVTADAGYYSKKNVEHVTSLGAEALIPPDKIRRKAWRAQQAPKGRIPRNLSMQDRMRRRLATKEGKRLYLQRQSSVEPVFGNAKGARGLRQFLHWGVEKNHHLFRLDMVAHNLLKIVRHIQRVGRPGEPPRRPKNPTKPTNPANGVLPTPT